MASATPPGHTDHEYEIGSGLECPQFACMEGTTDRHICFLLYRLFDQII